MSPSKQPFIGSIEDYRELFEEMEDIILIVNDKGTIEYVNRALRRHLGYKTKRFTGRNISECLLFDHSTTKKDILQQLFTERDFLTEMKISKDTTYHYAWRTKIFTHQGKKKVIAVVRDMTSQLELQHKVENYTKDLEERVYQRTQQLEKEKQKAIQMHQTKIVFLSKMSHELRTPLTAIRGYAELLQDHDLQADDRDKYMLVIQKNADRLLEMVNETLQIIQMEQDKYQVHERTFALKPLVQDLIETYTVLARQKGLILECQMAEDLPEQLHSDPNAIRQILTNLIGNAIKFTEIGGVKVEIKMRTIPSSMAKKLYFYVEDTGVGIPEEQHRRVFNTFEQYLDQHSVHSGGTGLGLPISRQLAKLLGGDVKLISSEPFKGSVFLFTMAVRTPQA